MRTLVVRITVVLLFLVVNCTAYAEPINPVTPKSSGIPFLQLGNRPNLSLRKMSLLDPDRFTMKQSTVMSFSSSGRMGSNLIGMYINTMEYRFNMPLTMRLKVAYQNNMGGLFNSRSSMNGVSGQQTGRLYIPAFDLVYTPWKNTVISFHYRDFSGANPNYGYRNGFRSRYGYGYPPY